MRLLLAAALIATAPAMAHEFQAGPLTIDHPVIYEGPPTLKTASGYMTIENAGEAADRLIGVRAEGVRASLHETREQDGVARMSPVDIIEIPAGGTLTFEPGGLHVMFMDADGAALGEGAELPAVLEFENAGDVAVTFHVEAREDGGHAGHTH